jgi:hypothetical protein
MTRASVTLSIKGWLLKRYLYWNVPRDSMNYKFRKARKYMGLSIEEAATVTGTTVEEVNLFEYGLSGIVYESEVFVL